MTEAGYSPGCIKTHVVRWKLHLLPFLKKHSTEIYTAALGREFLFENIPSLAPSTVKRFKRSIRILDAYITTGAIPKHYPRVSAPPLPGVIGDVAKAFLTYKAESRCSPLTIEHYQRLMSYFIIGLQRKSIESLSEITESDVLSFMNGRESKYSRFTVMRQFYQYVAKRHPESPDFSYLFEFMHHAPRLRLPSTYSKEEIEIIETSIDRTDVIGKRTYAMFLLASRLGLRISDTISLKFANIDWDGSIIRLTQAKTGRPIELPLLPAVGEALISYLKVRPECDVGEIFVTHTPPISKMNRSGAAKLISKAITGSGIDVKNRKHGPHSLRFSLATRMIEQGSALPIISETLGHGGKDTTMRYLRIDLKALKRCMLDVPPIKDDFYEQQNGSFYI